MDTKQNRLFMLITSAICLLPMLLGFLLSTTLPDPIPLQWSGDIVNVFMPKAPFLILTACSFLVFNIFLNLTAAYTKLKEKKTASLVIRFLIPALAVVGMGLVFFNAMK